MTRIEEKEKELKKRFNIKGVPTIIFLDKNGNEISNTRITGFVGPDEFLSRMQKVTKKDI